MLDCTTRDAVRHTHSANEGQREMKHTMDEIREHFRFGELDAAKLQRIARAVGKHPSTVKRTLRKKGFWPDEKTQRRYLRLMVREREEQGGNPATPERA